jgi:hypothetical protein
MGTAVLGLMLIFRILVPLAILLFVGSIVERNQAFR